MKTPNLAPSAHLSWQEVNCRDGTPYPEDWRTTRLPRLTTMFEDFRALVGHHPLVIGSCYRTPSWNRKQGGAQKSQHVRGTAIDVHCPKVMLIDEFRTLAKQFATDDDRVGGLGWYTWGVHLDVRPHTTFAFWNQVTRQTRLHDNNETPRTQW